MSASSVPGSGGYYGGDYWNGDLGHTVTFQTGAAVGTSIAFYSLLLDGDGNTVNTTLFDNVWTLAANGTLTSRRAAAGKRRCQPAAGCC